MMSDSLITPTEALLEVAKQHPFLAAVRSGGDEWSYAALWARVRQIADKIHGLDSTRTPIGLYTSLEIDFVAAAHAIWLSGRTVVFLSPDWAPEVLRIVVERANVHLILFGASSPDIAGVHAVSTLTLADGPKPSRHAAPSLLGEAVETVPLVCSITPTSGSTGVPKSIVYPMRRSLAVLSEESSTHFRPMDGQWLRGGITLLHPLFEVRRFMFNRTTLYLDASSSVTDQCIALYEELTPTLNSQMLRVHFTPSVFRAFADYVTTRVGGSGLPRGSNRVYWMVIGGELLDVRDVDLATVIFPSATIACNYACSEVGFTGISQMLIHPTDPIPSSISFGPTQGCTDMILLDESLSVIPQNEEGATGIVGFVTSQSPTGYLDDEESSQNMFRPWAGDDILLYTDDIGCMQADGTIAIRGRSSRTVKVDRLFVDLDYVERALAPAFTDKALSITGFKLLKSNASRGIVLVVGTRTADAMFVLKHARDHLRVSHGDDFASVIRAVRCILEMPFNASHKIDLVELQKIVDSKEKLPPGRFADTPVTSVLSRVAVLAVRIAAEITKLSKSPDTVPTDLPLVYSGLTSIAMVRLYFWLQSEYEYPDQMHHLFDEDVTAQVLALEILPNEEHTIEEVKNNTSTPGLISHATVVEDEGIEPFGFEKDPDYPVRDPTKTADYLIEKENEPCPPYSFNPRPVNTPIVMQPPLEFQVPEVVTDVNHPTLRIGLFGFLFVSWMTPLLFLGSKRSLLESDLHPLRRNDEAAVVGRWVDLFWTQLRTWFFDKGRKKPKLFGSIFAAAYKLWLISGILRFLSVYSAILVPLVLQQIIITVNAPAPPAGNATALAEYNSVVELKTGGFPPIIYNTYALGVLLMGLGLIFTFCGRSADQLVKRMALDVRTALISAVYRKSLRLSAENNQKYSKSYIMNLVNIDCESVSNAWEVVHLIWSIPLQLVIITIFLSRLLGVSAWASVGVLTFCFFLLVMALSMFMRKAASGLLRLGDRRFKTIREVLDGIYAVKINGREKYFLAKLEDIHTEQLRWLRKFNMGVATFVTIGQVANTVIPLATFSLFEYENMGTIHASRVFPSLSFFSILLAPLTSLPQLLSAMVIASISWGRIYAFLLADEKIPANDSSDSCMNIGHAITIIDGAFSWTALDSDAALSHAQGKGKSEAPSIDEVDKVEASDPAPFLHNVNITIRRGSLTAIVGHVGSGKSSLLSAILGDMIRVSGEVYCIGSIAYCAQQPWVQASTIQDNILFGRPLDIRQLQKAIQTTCFDSDLETFPHGMATLISEKGNNLSGGQRARLALSRAVYSDADIYLFDDVLASLDRSVGRTVFDNCIKHALQGKTRVLVTNQLQYLNQVDHIVVVSDGSIVEQGTFGELLHRNGELTRLLSDAQTTSEDSNDNAKKDDKCKSALGPPEATVKQELAIEERNTDSVGAATWWAYLRATGGIAIIIMLLLEIVLLQGGIIVLNQCLSWRTEGTWHGNAEVWIGISFASVLAVAVLNATILMSTSHASRKSHSLALRGVIYAPMWWFENQPISHIMDRFSKDIEAIDQRLMPRLFQLVAGVGNLIPAIAILSFSTPIMLTFVGPMVIVSWFVLGFYRKSFRELKHLESSGRGPLQSRISETLDGIPTITAYGRETDFENAIGRLLDVSNKPTFLRMHAEIWVTLRLEIMSSLIVFALVMLAHTKLIGGRTQFVLALTYASTLTHIMNLFLKSAFDVEAEMNSVERLMNYTSLLKEDPTEPLSDPAEGTWPSRGEIVLRDIDAIYHSHPNRLVLRNITLTFYPGETVVIVGRAGSGKSALLSLLLRTIESSNGTIEIDGREIKSLGVATLRRSIQAISQDPLIFSGTIRSSLDFDDRHSDDVLWQALDLVGLKKFVASQESKLDAVVKYNGSNYSVGQRQLLCLAAAILRNPRILLFDGATLDATTDVLIQQAMHRSCPHATILRVVHQLSDGMLRECDKVLVMEQGVPIEYAPPEVLLARPNSMLSKLMTAARNHHQAS